MFIIKIKAELIKLSTTGVTWKEMCLSLVQVAQVLYLLYKYRLIFILIYVHESFI